MKLKIRLDGQASKPIFQQIVDEIEKLIITNEFREGDFLPSVRDFAVSHSVNPNTVSKAYQILQAKDFVEPVRGLGLKVKKISSHSAETKKSSLLNEKIDGLIDLARTLQIDEAELVKLLKGRMKKL